MPGTTAEEGLEYKDVFSAIDDVAREYVLADLSLLQATLRSDAAQSAIGIPALTTINDLRVRLWFDVTAAREGGLSFGFGRKKKSERVADFEISADVGPTMLQQSGSQSAKRIVGRVPGFIISAGDFGINIEFLDGASHQFRLVRFNSPNILSPPDKELTASMAGALLELLIDWNEARGTSDSRQLDPVTRVADNRLLMETAQGVASLLANMDAYCDNNSLAAATAGESFVPPSKDTIKRASRLRKQVEPVLGEDSTLYHYQRLSIRLRAALDPRGVIATKPNQDGSRRWNIEGRLSTDSDKPEFQFDLRIPDILKEGPIYQTILAEARAGKKAKDFRKKIRKHEVFGKRLIRVSEWEQFVQEAQHFPLTRAIRLKRHDQGEDYNLLLLAGFFMGAEVVLGFRHRVKFADREAPADELEVLEFHDVELVLSKEDDGEWRPYHSFDAEEGDEKINEYLTGVLYSLRTWSMRFA